MHPKPGIVKEFTHAGLPCILAFYLGGDFPHFSGYVEVPKGHPGYGCLSELDVPEEYYFAVHGCITYSENGVLGHPGWWLGFDCGHSEMGYDENYWTTDMAEKELRSFAEKLSKE